MTSRPSVKPKRARPNSAVYIGSDPHILSSTTPPSIPDLPEPPSPTSSSGGSGLPSPPATNSTGSGSTGDPASIALRNTTMLTDSNLVKTFHTAFSNNHDDEDDDDNDYDEDNTAKLDRRHSLNENIQALQRVKSLTLRNREALDKLSSFSRIGSPSMRTANRHSLSSDHLSGSETERESLHPPPHSSSSNSSSSNRPTTPAASTRVRLISAPESPGKVLRTLNSTRRSDVTQLALAAVATSRQSPTARKRQPLPKEWSTSSSSSGSLENGRYSAEPSPRSTNLQLSPRTSIRHSTLRNRTSQSYDLDQGNRADTGRRQSLRGGSAESALAAAASNRLVGEGLRAAGINRRSRDLSSDLFDSPISDERSGSRLGRVQSERERRGTITPLSHQRSKTDYEEVSALRSFKSAYPLREPDRAPSSLSRNSPMPQRRSNPSANESEHTRLMHESLSMFESQLSRLSPHLFPSSSSSSSGASPRGGNELMKNAESLVNTAEKLNILLRQSTNRALEAQIDAEVNSPSEEDQADVWRRVGGEYRENLRVSDELVRSVTSLLLGVSRTIREMAPQGEHGRSVSLDEAASGGRRSVGDRRSWEGRESALGVRSRPSSVLREREREREEEEQTPPSTSKTAPRNGSMRRVTGVSTMASQETLHAYEPSPTPASRTKRSEPSSSRALPLPPLSIPKPLPTLPSEQNKQTPARRPSVSNNTTTPARRKTSVSTVRAPLFPAMSTPTTTTAVTLDSASSGDAVAFPLVRSDSAKSTHSVEKPERGERGNGRGTVTFSRSATISVSALQHLHRDRKRTISTSEGEQQQPPGSATVTLPISKTLSSGSETEPQRKRPSDRSVRISLDGAEGGGKVVHPADRSAASVLGTRTGARERRRTVVDIWPPGK